MINFIRKADRKTLTLLGVITLVALTDRLWGITFGWNYRPDEAQIFTIIEGLTHRLYPGNLIYPSLFKYLALLLYVVMMLPKLFAGELHTARDFVMQLYAYPEHYVWATRMLVALFGTATVFMVFRTAKERFNENVAFVAAFVLAVCSLHVRNSHFGTTDVPMTFFVVMTEFFVGRILLSEDRKNYLLAGLFAGLAASTKYTGVLVATSIFAAHVAVRRKLFDKRLFQAAGMTILGLLATTPFIIFSHREFYEEFRETARLQHLGVSYFIERGWSYYARIALWHGLGGAVVISSLLGVLVLAWRKQWAPLVLLTCPLVYYAVVGEGYNVFLRYAVPLTPYVSIFAAIFIVALSEKLNVVGKRKLTLAIAFVLAIFFSSESILNVVKFDHLLTLEDTRTEARSYFDHAFLPRKTVYVTGATMGRVELSPHFVVINDLYAPLSESELPDYVVIQSSYFKFPQIRDAQQTMAVVNKYYTIKKKFTALVSRDTDDTYDEQDAFFTPFSGFRSMTRPGPDLTVYERKH